MKNLYPKSKGKVYPSPSSPSPSSSPSSLTTKHNPDSALSVLKFLPAAILALASILSLEDREVLAYLITTNTNSNSNPSPAKKTKCKKPHTPHKPPVFDCGCFECYTRYWYRWDSSPNRELIHQVLEAFEDHLNSTNNHHRSKTTRGKKREKVFDKTPTKKELEAAVVVPIFEAKEEIRSVTHVMPGMEAFPVVGFENESEVLEEKKEESEEGVVENENVSGSNEESEEMVQVVVNSSNHKGLARKVLPDVMGLFNSRIWNLWSTNI